MVGAAIRRSPLPRTPASRRSSGCGASACICVEHGLERALEGKDPERDYLRKLDGKGEAQLIALCCGPAPEGRARWTLRLLAGRLVELEVVDAICHETVRAVLKKTNSSRGAKSSG